MRIEELNREQLQEIKCRYYVEKTGKDISYLEMATIDNRVTDTEIFEEYGGITFTEEDFFTATEEE